MNKNTAANSVECDGLVVCRSVFSLRRVGRACPTNGGKALAFQIIFEYEKLMLHAD
jgi:hypothetical protein